MNLVLMGAPGSGKGTQARIIGSMLKIPSISTGNILWAAVREQTPLGHRIEKLMGNGQLVPDDIIIKMVNARIEKDDCKNGYILDGFPRTVAQAKAIDSSNINIDEVIFLDVPDNVIKERVGGRRVCKICGTAYHERYNPPLREGICDECGGEIIARDDDRPETVEKRLKVYHGKTAAVLDYYRDQGMLKVVDANHNMEITTELTLAALGMKV